LPDDSFWRRRRVFVTGGTGLLGGWLVKDLAARGADLVVLVRDVVPQSLFFREGWPTRVTTVRGDISDHVLLRRALCEYEIDTVFHLAAQALVGVAKNDPVGTLETNVRGTWNLLEAVRSSPVRQVVVASSDKAYGIADRLPYTEQHPLRGEFPYEVSKSCADLVCAMYARTYGVPVCVTRCGNLYGGGDLNWSRTVPGVIRAAYFGQPFEIRSDGKFVRDVLYVGDAADAYIGLAASMAADRRLLGEAFNFSIEARLTVLEVVRKTLELMGKPDLELRILNQASTEIREQYMTSEKARSVLGWRPKHGFEAGLVETIAWYREFFAAEADTGRAT